MSEIRRVGLDSISERWQRSPWAAGVSDPLEQDQEVAGECEHLKLTGPRYRVHFKHKNFICHETEHRVACPFVRWSGPGFVGFKCLSNKIFNPIADQSDRALR